MVKYFVPQKLKSFAKVKEKGGQVKVLAVEVTSLCRLIIYTDKDFHLNMGFK